MTKTNSLYRHVAVILFYLAVAGIYTWPLLLHITDHTAGTLTVDRDQNLWFFWWVKQAIVNYHVSPYSTNFLYYPGGTDLYIYPANLIGSLAGIVLQSLFGLVTTFNIIYFVGFVGGAWGAYCLARYLVPNTKAALLAGLVYAFAPWQAPTSDFNQLTIAQIEWLPFLCLWLLNLLDALQVRDRKLVLRYGTLAAIFLVIIAFTDEYHLLYAGFVTAFLVGWRVVGLLWQKDWWQARLIVGVAIVIVLPALLAYSPLLIGIAKESTAKLFMETSNDYTEGADLLAIFCPWPALWGLKGFSLQYLPHFLVWLMALGIGLLGIIRGNGTRKWLVLFVIAATLSLGTKLVFNGVVTDIPMPGKLINKIPVLNSMHYAWRWLIPGALALSVCVASGFNWLEQLVRGKLSGVSFRLSFANLKNWQLLVPVVLIAIFVVGSSPQPVPWDRWEVAPTPSVFTSGLLTQPGALLELPFDDRNHHKADNMRYQTDHGRPIVSGYLARPPIYFQDRTDVSNYATPTPFYDYGASPLAFLFEDDRLQLGQPDAVEASSEQLRSFLAYNNFAYIVLYKSVYGEQLDPARYNQLHSLVSRIEGPNQPCTYEDAALLVCPVVPPAQYQPLVTVSRGWYGAENQAGGQRWLYGQEGFLAVFAPQTGTYNFSFNSAAYLKPRQLQLEVDGKPINNLSITTARQPYQLQLNLTAGNHLIRLYSPESPDRPSNNGTPSDTRALTLLFSQIHLTAQ